MNMSSITENLKIIDGHAHVGYTGGWADVGITEEELLAQMDAYHIEKTALCNEDNDITLGIMERHPDRIIGCVYVNPLNPATVDSMEEYFAKGFTAVKLNPLRHAYCADTAALVMLQPFPRPQFPYLPNGCIMPST